MQQLLDQLTVVRDNDIIVKPCLTINFFFRFDYHHRQGKIWTNDVNSRVLFGENHADKKVRVGRLFDDYHQFIQDQGLGDFRFMAHPQTKKWIDLNQDPFARFSFNALLQANYTEAWFGHYHGGLQAHDASDIFFSTQAGRIYTYLDSLNHVSLGLPAALASTEEGCALILEKVRQWTQLVQPSFGYVAIETMRHNTHANLAIELEYQYAMQYSGLGLHYPQHICRQLRHGDAENKLAYKEISESNYFSTSYPLPRHYIYGVQWLTMVSEKLLGHDDYQPVLAELQAQTLAQSQAEEWKVEKIEDVFLLQTETMPAITEIPASYQQLAQLLSPLYYPDFISPHLDGMRGFTTHKQYQQWLERFQAQ